MINISEACCARLPRCPAKHTVPSCAASGRMGWPNSGIFAAFNKKALDLICINLVHINLFRNTVNSLYSQWKWSDSLSHIQHFATPYPWNSPSQNTAVGGLSLFQGIFPTQGSNPGVPHWRWILYQLGHKGSPRTLEWVVYPFCRGSSWPRNRTGVSCIAGGFLTNWAIREAAYSCSYVLLNHCEHRISEYWIVTPRGDIGLGSCKSLVTCLKRNQYKTLFYVCFCLKTHYLIYVINARMVKFTASRTITDA